MFFFVFKKKMVLVNYNNLGAMGPCHFLEKYKVKQYSNIIKMKFLPNNNLHTFVIIVFQFKFIHENK